MNKKPAPKIFGMMDDMNDIRFLERKSAVYAGLERTMHRSLVPELFQRLLSVDAKNHKELDAMLWFFNEGKWRNDDEMAKAWNVSVRTLRDANFASFQSEKGKQKSAWAIAEKESSLSSAALLIFLAGLFLLGSTKIEALSYVLAILAVIGVSSGFTGMLPILACFAIAHFALFIPLVTKLFTLGLDESAEADIRSRDELEGQGISLDKETVKTVAAPFLGINIEEEEAFGAKKKKLYKSEPWCLGIGSCLIPISALFFAYAARAVFDWFTKYHR